MANYLESVVTFLKKLPFKEFLLITLFTLTSIAQHKQRDWERKAELEKSKEKDMEEKQHE